MINDIIKSLHDLYSSLTGLNNVKASDNQPIISDLATEAFKRETPQMLNAVQQSKNTTPPVQQNPGYNISVPSDSGMTQLPPQISQLLGNTFDQQGVATDADRVLIHPTENTALPGEQQQGINTGPNSGENPQFKTSNIDVPNPDGSIDRGLFRINSNTFNTYMSSPAQKNVLSYYGINSWDDMNDPNKNAVMAKLIHNDTIGPQSSKGNWGAWFAAPASLRSGGTQ
jgi:hypothetical protein